MSAEVYKLSGAPGVGKTSRLFDLVREERERGTKLTDLYYLTFARSARSESQAELCEVFADTDIKEDDIKKRAKTFHGATWVACAGNDLWEDPGKQIIQPSTDEHEYRTFCNRVGLKYAGKTDALRAERDGEDVSGNGDRLFAISDWLSLTCRPPEDHHLAPTSLPLDHTRAVDLLREWEEYKRNGGAGGGLPRYEHTDYVDVALERDYRPPASVLFIDEFQDLAPQEYALFKQWRDSGQFDRIYIAGDENQSIYSFRAGTPLYFEETDTDSVESKKMSYRCPSEIVAVARGVLRACEHTEPRGFQAYKHGGEALRVSLPEASDLAGHVVDQAHRHDAESGEASVYILARANYQVRAIARMLIEHGVPYDYLGSKTSAWREPLPEIYHALTRLNDPTGGISTELTHNLLDYTPGSGRRAQLDTMGDVYPTADVVDALADLGTPKEIVGALDLRKRQKDMLRGALSGADVSPEDVKIGTIHSAKGLEAPCVLLVENTTSRLKDVYYSDPDVAAEEHRLGYVGATRASETLHVVADLFDSPVSPVFDGELPRNYAVAEGAGGEA